MNITSLFLLILMTTCFLCGCAVEPTIDVKLENKEGKTRFKVESHHVNGLLALRLRQKESNAALWSVNLKYFNGAEIVYGAVPKMFRVMSGLTESAEQIFPPSRQAPPTLPLAANFLLEIDAQYDSGGTPASRTFVFPFATDSNGGLQNPDAL